MTITHIQTPYFQLQAETKKRVKEYSKYLSDEKFLSRYIHSIFFLSSSLIGLVVGFVVDGAMYLFSIYQGFYATAGLLCLGFVVNSFLIVRDKLFDREIKKDLDDEVYGLSEELNSWFMLTHYLSVSESERGRIAESMFLLETKIAFRTTDNRLCTLIPRKGTNIWDLNKGSDIEPVVPSAVEKVWTPAANDTYIQVQKSISSLRACVLTVEEDHEVSRAENTLEELVNYVTQLTHLDKVTENDSERIIHTMNILNDGLQRIFTAKTNNVRKNLNLIHGFVADNDKVSKGSNLSL